MPTATLIGFGLVAVAIYFGMQSRHSTLQASAQNNSATWAPEYVSSSATSTAAQSTRASTVLSIPATAGPRDELLQRAVSDAAKALDAHRSRLQGLCKPVSMVTYQLNFSFSPEGHQIARGISVPRNARDSVADCVQLKLPEITIAPPGVPLSIDVPFTL